MKRKCTILWIHGLFEKKKEFSQNFPFRAKMNHIKILKISEKHYLCKLSTTAAVIFI
jgi:hypothetical protein